MYMHELRRWRPLNTAGPHSQTGPQSYVDMTADQSVSAGMVRRRLYAGSVCDTQHHNSCGMWLVALYMCCYAFAFLVMLKQVVIFSCVHVFHCRVHESDVSVSDAECEW